MERRDAVDLVRADKGEVAHSHPPARMLVDHRDRRQEALIDEAAPPRAVEMRRIDQVDDLHMPRQHPLHQRHRPGLERFRQQGVVGVGEHGLRDRPRLVPFDLVEVDEDAHQFGDPDRRMSVVELDGGVLAERAHVAPLLDVAANEIEQRRRSEEIFLPEPQFLAGRRRVAWVENLGDRFRPHGFGKRADVIAGVEGFELERVGRPRRPQAQRIDVPAAPADDRRVVGDRFDRLGGMPDVVGALVVALDHFDPTAEADGVVVFGADEFPRIAVDEPVLGGFLLPAAADDLPEQAVVVADAIAMRGDGERRHAVHEAGGETPEAAVAERGVGLDPAQIGEVDAEFIERFGHRRCDAEIGHRVEQQAPDQEFEREIIDPLAPVGVNGVQRFKPASHRDVAGCERDGEKPVARARDFRRLADGIGQFRQHRGLEFGCGIRTQLGRLRRGFFSYDELVHEVSRALRFSGATPKPAGLLDV